MRSLMCRVLNAICILRQQNCRWAILEADRTATHERRPVAASFLDVPRRFETTTAAVWLGLCAVLVRSCDFLFVRYKRVPLHSVPTHASPVHSRTILLGLL